MPNLSPGGGLPTVSAAGDNDALLLRVNGDPSDSRIVVSNLLNPASIKAKYESNADTNAFTDALLTKLNGVATGAEVNVQADWNAVSGDAFILNKPTFAAVATTGDYGDLLNPPSIPQSGVDFVPVSGGSFSGAIVTTQLTIGATPFTEANLIDLTDGGETTLHDHAAANLSVDQTNLVVASGATVQAYIESSDQALLKARNTGLLSGGELTDLGAGVVRIASGTGQILDITALPTLDYYNVSWAQTDLNLSAVDQVYYIYVNSLGQVLTTTTEPDHAEYRDFIWLHRVSIRGGIASGLTSIVAPTVQLNASLYDLWAAIGLIKEGLALTANGANLSLNIGSGNIYVPGIGFYVNAKNPNEVTISAQSPLIFRHVLRDGTQGGDTTLLDVANYDLNGVLTPVPNPGATATIFQLMAFPGGPNYRMVYGQTTYSTVSAAFVALENGNYKPVIPATYASGAIVLGWVIVQKSATALNDGAQIFVSSNRFGEYGGGISTTGAVSLLAANNLSDLSNVTTARTNLGVYSTAQVDTLVPDSTTNLPEGTNLYYTEARVTANTTVAANTAKLATIATGAEVNVNADWSATSGDAQILNKPTIPTSTTEITEGTNLYYTEARVTANATVAANTSKLATIATGAEVNVNADWNAVSGDAQILNKPTIPTSTTQITEGTNLYFTTVRADASDSGQYAIARICDLYVGATALPSTLDPENPAEVDDVAYLSVAPYRGTQVALYDTGDQRWYLRNVSLAGTTLTGLVANTLFDLYIRWGGSSIQFTTRAWTGSGAGTSTRTANTFIDGVPTLSTDASYRHIATFRTAVTGTTSDSAQSRLVSNVAQKRWKNFSISNDPVDYTYTSTTLREFGNGVSQRVNIAASEGTLISASSTLFCRSSGALPINGGTGGIGVNSTTVRSGASSQAANQVSSQRLVSVHTGTIPAGYNYLAMLEQGFDGNGSTTDDIEMQIAVLSGAVYL